MSRLQPDVSIAAARSVLACLPQTIVAFVLSLGMATEAMAVTLRGISPAPAVEGGGSVAVTVQLEFDSFDNPTTCQVSGTLTTQDNSALAGSDYQATTTPFTLQITPAQNPVQQQITLGLVDDAVAEPDELFDTVVATTDVSGCPLPVSVVQANSAGITDDDPGNASFTFGASVLSINENAGTADVQVTLNGTASLQSPFVASVDVTTLDGSANSNNDFTALSNTLTFDQTQSSQIVSVPITNDAVSEATETFSIRLSNPTLLLDDSRNLSVALPVTTVTVTVVDDDNGGTLQFANGNVSAPEAGGALTVTVDRVGGTLGAVTVDYATVAGTATAGTDFAAVGGTLTWAAGDSSPRTFVVPILDDQTFDPNEILTLTLRNATGGAVTGADATVTIADDEAQLDAGGDVTIAASAGANVSSTFAVTGTPPLTLTAQLGTLTPNTLNAPGNATYDYVVPASTPAGTNIVDTVTVTDAGGNSVAKQITLQVAAPAARNLSDIQSLTPNQRAFASWFDDFCPRIAATGAATAGQADLVGVCASLRDPATSDAQAIAALDAIKPEEILSAAMTTLQLSGQQHGNLEQRINALRSGATGIDLAGLDLNIGGTAVPGVAVQSLVDALTGGAASADDFGRWGVFVNGRIDFGEKDRTEAEAGFDFDTFEVTTGIDYRVRDDFVVGAAIGYNKIDTNFDSSGGSLDIESWNASVFTTYFSSDRFYVDASLNYGDNTYDSKRHIVYSDIGGTVDRQATSDSDGREVSGGIATGYDFGYGAWTFGPHVGSYYTDVSVDEFVERGAGGLDMVVSDQQAKSFTLNGGVHASYVFALGWGVLIPHMRADVVHEFEDGRELVNVRVAADPFAVDPSDPTPDIVLQTDRLDADYFVWSAGASAQFVNGMAGFVSYRSTSGYEDLTLSEVTYGLRWERTF